MKKIIIIHHHLHPGGVTTVIRSQVKSLHAHAPGRLAGIICGACPDPQWYRQQGVPVAVCPDLQYRTTGFTSREQFDQLLAGIVRQLKEHCTKSHILHIHNLNLGKNPVFTLAVYLMAQEGYSIVNHCHDFAEDRPDNYRYLQSLLGWANYSVGEVMYPELPNYAYAVLSAVDRNRLVSYGVAQDNVRLLPNPVIRLEEYTNTLKTTERTKLCQQLGLDVNKKIVTYPVRVIQRKNIGELILLAVLFEDQAQFLVTMAPKNPDEIGPYTQWKALCHELHVDLRFEVGQQVDFDTIITGSDFCITTSIREGFGMAYLEPWLYGTPVVGREIAYLMDDFRQHGITFPGLYQELVLVYGGIWTAFTRLPAQHQMELLRQLRNNPASQGIIRNANPLISNVFDTVPQDLINSNRAIIQKQYSLERYASILLDLYSKFD